MWFPPHSYYYIFLRSKYSRHLLSSFQIPCVADIAAGNKTYQLPNVCYPTDRRKIHNHSDVCIRISAEQPCRGPATSET
jgi:hypothetical protein